jgi:phenylpyruvate tautomerase PptA (4-oxalocrotonate tautomerase family)
MPIVDVEVVGPDAGANGGALAQALADAAARVFGAPAASTWVRVRALAPAAYAENGAPLVAAELPVFVTVRKRAVPARDALAAEVRALTDAVAAILRCPTERVHVEYAPALAGRMAFGGQLVE